MNSPFAIALMVGGALAWLGGGAIAQSNVQGANTSGAPNSVTAPIILDESQISVDPTDQRFVTKAAQINMGEIQEANLAVHQSSSDAVRRFAQMMIDDHTAANFPIVRVASLTRTQYPLNAGRDADSSFMRLSTLSGPNFDRQYLQQQVKDHRMAIRLFQEEASHLGANPNLVTIANSTLPALRDHLAMAQDLLRNGGNSTAVYHRSMDYGTTDWGYSGTMNNPPTPVP